ncbi:MAG: DUF6583 family protein [Clostridia bacterium]|nr:DUF6583 family protein [Clostridia bacterium]
MKFKKISFSALFVAAMLMLSALLGSCLDKKPTFDTPVEYARYVEKQEINSTTHEIMKYYNNIVSESGKAVSGNVEIDIDISDNALALIELAARSSGTDIDLSWLSNISLDGSVYTSDNLMSLDLMLGLGDADILGIASVFDYENGASYLTLSDIMSKYLKVDFASALEGADDSIVIPEYDFSKLPSSTAIEALLNKYVGIIVDGIKTAERSSGTLTANGVEENCEVVKITITANDAKDIALAVLGEVKKDEGLKKAIVDICAWIGDIASQYGEEFTSGEEAYAELCKMADEAIAELGEFDAEESEEVLVITDYVNDDLEVIGRDISFDGENIITYGYASNNKNFGFEMSVDGEKIAEGTGTEGDKLNGEFTFYTYDHYDGGKTESALLVSVKDFDMKKLDKGYISGIIDISLDGLSEDFGDAVVSSILSNYSIRLELDQKDENNGKIALGLVSGEEYFVKFTIGAATGKGMAPSIPSDDNVISVPIDGMDDATSQALGLEIIKSVDFNALMENLENSPVPKEYVDIIRQYVALFSMIG